MNFWRNGEVKKWGFINLLIVAAAVVVTYIRAECESGIGHMYSGGCAV